MTLDPRWKFPQGKSPEHLYDALYQLIRELRKGDEEGTWEPVLTFATPGDVSVAYGAQFGLYTKRGRAVTVHCQLFAAATWSTASGAVRVTGLPYTAAASPAGMFYRGTMRWQGIDIVDHTEVCPRVAAGENFVGFTAVGMGQDGRNVVATDMISGNDSQFSFHLNYFV